jgi:hypothetical protein
LISLSDGTKLDRRTALVLALGSALAILAIVAVTGCSSEQPNQIGSSLVTDHIDSILVPLTVEEITLYSALRVENPAVTVDKQEVMYIGERGGTRSGAILANYDFDIDFTFDYPETLFTEENIKLVKFSLFKVDYYGASEGTGGASQPVDLYYELRAMEAPFDPAAYVNYPVTTPDGIGPFLNSDFSVPNNSDEPFLTLYDSVTILNWIANEDTVGIRVAFGASSDSGLVGFGSLELTHYNELQNAARGTVVAPNFVIQFENRPNEPNEFLLIAPYADTSTFEQVPEAPAGPDGGFLLRTGLRSYPALMFDLSGLPPHAFINRALLSVTNDTTLSFGTLSSVAVLEWDVEKFGVPNEPVELDLINDPSERYSFHVTGQNSLDPTFHTTINFDVSQAILRVNNEVYAGTRGFLLTGAEDFLPEGFFDPTPPDFYYREFRFFGAAAADPAQRPYLKITYSVVNDLEEGGK